MHIYPPTGVGARCLDPHQIVCLSGPVCWCGIQYTIDQLIMIKVPQSIYMLLSFFFLTFLFAYVCDLPDRYRLVRFIRIQQLQWLRTTTKKMMTRSLFLGWALQKQTEANVPFQKNRSCKEAFGLDCGPTGQRLLATIIGCRSECFASLRWHCVGYIYIWFLQGSRTTI